MRTAEEIVARTRELVAAGTAPTFPRGTAAGPIAHGPVPLPLILPCRHGGTDDDVIEYCHSCGGGGQHVRHCEVHERCSREPRHPSIMSCRRCQTESLGFEPAGSG